MTPDEIAEVAERFALGAVRIVAKQVGVIERQLAARLDVALQPRLDTSSVIAAVATWPHRRQTGLLVHALLNGPAITQTRKQLYATAVAHLMS